jgi:hypothetical protein
MTEILITIVAAGALIAILALGVVGHGALEVGAAMLVLLVGVTCVLAVMRRLLDDDR